MYLISSHDIKNTPLLNIQSRYYIHINCIFGSINVHGLQTKVLKFCGTVDQHDIFVGFVKPWNEEQAN